MKLSIITCTYNSEKYLQETIESVINQNLDNTIFEHIFIDWNSKDKTIEIINIYIKNNPEKNIKLIQKEPKWIYNAMNEWIRLAKWKYLLFLHSDDYLEKNALWEYLNFIKNTWNLDLYYGKFNAVDKNWKFIYNAPSRKIYQKWLKKWIFWLLCYINQPAVIHKKNLHDRFWYFNENLKIKSDREFWIKLAKGKIVGLFYNKTITNFRIHESWTSNNSKLEKISKNEDNYIWDKYYWIEKYLFKCILFIYKKFS